MLRALAVVCVLLVSAPVAAAQEPGATPAPIVFFTVFAPDGDGLQRFYREVFAWQIGPDGSLTIGAPTPLSGQVGEDLKNPADTILYIGVPDVTTALAKVKEHGGRVQFPRLEVAGRVVLGLFTDPAGNRVGLVEMENGKAKVPGR